MPATFPSVQQHFTGRAPNVSATYKALLAAAQRLGHVEVQPKKTSIHLLRNTAFAGVATQKVALLLTLKASTDIKSPRILRHEQASANRWHLIVKLTSPKEIDAELSGWLEAAYGLVE
jgi:hypothetical protein